MTAKLPPSPVPPSCTECLRDPPAQLDTHGFELQIIQGAEEMLRNTELAVIEAYIFRLNENALLSHELCAEMDKRGFQLVDFSEPMWRNKDMALWQWDLFFVKKSNPVFRSNAFA